MNTFLTRLLATAAIVTRFSMHMSAAEPNQAGDGRTNALKEVLLRGDGKDRHWVIKTNGLIVQEHYLTAHGDEHVVIDYAKGVQAPQVNAPKRDSNAVSVVTVFWRNGKQMSRTPEIGGVANGDDCVWWPNGRVARKAHFAQGKPDGVWKYSDENGRSVGEGTFALGTRQSGIFLGSDDPGGNFFLTIYPMKKSRYENGQLKEEQDWLKELIME